MGKKKSASVSVRLYTRGCEILVAACDVELLGRRFRQGEALLHADPAFYDGEIATPDVLCEHLRSATMANLVGPLCVEAAVEAGFIRSDCVLYVDGVPHAQMFRV